MNLLVLTMSANCFSFWGTSSVRPPVGASPMNLTGPPDPLGYHPCPNENFFHRHWFLVVQERTVKQFIGDDFWSRAAYRVVVNGTSYGEP